MREHSVIQRLAAEEDFHWRGEEITRLEGFSDAVFAFAITLLVVSLEVPRTFQELLQAVQGFAPFGVSFAFLASVWFIHYRFYRRYGLEDPWSVFLNCALLFCVVFFVYPLKFLAVGMFESGSGLTGGEARQLFTLYGAGFTAIFAVYSLLYFHAWGKRDALALNRLERLKTRQSLANHLALTAVGLISILLANSLPLQWVGVAGYFYFVIGAYFTAAGTIFGRKEKLIKKELETEAANSAVPN